MGLSTLAAPYVFEANGRWMGSDGNWSTFSVGIGTPPQYFDLLPSTISSETWIPSSAGCSWSPPWLDCGASRGVEAKIGPESQGFESNMSSTWDLIGLYGLATENNLYGYHNNTGEYGQDTMTLRSTSWKRIPQQLVAGIATADFWLGTLGLGGQASSFSVRETNPQSLLLSMKSLGMISSLSYGYTAGASYHATPGRLIGGGYDGEAFTPSGLQFDVDSSDGYSLPVTLKGLVVADSPSGTISVPIDESSGIVMSVDSTVSQLWLPDDMCNALSTALGLTWDSVNGLYTVNSSAHQRLLHSDPQFTLTLTANSSSNDSVNIVLPYAAFDQRAYLPYYNVSTPYFPIRRAAYESQFVLGRTFLQEAYIVVDWERRNFTLGQVVHSPTKSGVVVIAPFELPKDSTSLSTKAVVGIAVGVVAGVIILALLTWGSRKMSKRRHVKAAQTPVCRRVEMEDGDVYEMGGSDCHELATDGTKRHELGSSNVFEMFEERLYQHLTSSQVYELNARCSVQELEGNWI